MMVVHFLLLIIILLLCSIRCKRGYREHLFLPICFILLALYWALMYDYGLDYWNYYDIFYKDPYYGDGRGEPFFWKIFFSFPNYYLFVVFYGIVVSSIIYYFVKKTIPPTYYWYFFLVFMLHPSLCLNMTYVFRSAIGSCIIWIAIYRYYVKRVDFTRLYLLIGAASLIHHSLALCVLLPLVGYLLQRVPSFIIFILLIIALCIGMSGAMELFASFVGAMEAFEAYSHYGADRIDDPTITMLLSRALHLIPAFFILHYKNTNEYTNRLSGVCMFYYLVYFIGFDMLGRLTMMLYVFVIICTIAISNNKNWIIKTLILSPSVLFAAYRNIMFYMEMATTRQGDPGNMMKYSSIFRLLNG